MDKRQKAVAFALSWVIEWIMQSKGAILFICGLMLLGTTVCIGLILYYGG